MRALVVFDSRFGNTEKIARSLSTGLSGAGVEAVCENTKNVRPESLVDYDLICVGAPTEWLSASKPMKEFLEGLRTTRLSDKLGFAFDTRLNRPLSGSGSGFIEKELSRRGLSIIAPRESASVYSIGSGMSGMTLKEGEVERFERVGADLAAKLNSMSRSHAQPQPQP